MTERRAGGWTRIVAALTIPSSRASPRTLTMWRSEDDWKRDSDWASRGGFWPAGWRPAIPSTIIPRTRSDSRPRGKRIIESRGPSGRRAWRQVTRWRWGVSLVLAEPVAGAYPPGVTVPSGQPRNGGRQILEIAGDLRDLATQTEGLWERYGRR